MVSILLAGTRTLRRDSSQTIEPIRRIVGMSSNGGGLWLSAAPAVPCGAPRGGLVMPTGQALPIVAIIGRPNVGKSTLFNRYARRRRVLVDDAPGITRDRIAEEIDVEGRRILLADTAGLDPAAGDAIDRAVQEQARAAMEDADAILFVVDGRAGRLPEDEAVARMLHKSDCPVMLLVNKLDQPMHDDGVNDFLGLGFEHTEPVSAEHGRGAWDALETLVADIASARGRSRDGARGPAHRAGRPSQRRQELAHQSPLRHRAGGGLGRTGHHP